MILYQLLAGELPFRGNKAMLLHQVLHDDPRSLRSLNDKIPRDLETIALKAMAKEPARRYSSARELADELRRWLNGAPILARPMGPMEHGWRWCKRNPTLAASLSLAASSVLLALAAFAVATMLPPPVGHYNRPVGEAMCSTGRVIGCHAKSRQPRQLSATM